MSSFYTRWKMFSNKRSNTSPKKPRQETMETSVSKSQLMDMDPVEFQAFAWSTDDGTTSDVDFANMNYTVHILVKIEMENR